MISAPPRARTLAQSTEDRHPLPFRKIKLLTLLALLGLALIGWGNASASTTSVLSKNCAQCLLVTSPSWSSSTGTLLAFERIGAEQWQQRGHPVEVRLGRAGMAWGRGIWQSAASGGPKKTEGDKRAPAGVFELLSCFGYSAQKPPTHMPYRQVTSDTITVDDPASRFYNRMLSASSVSNPDWQSAEKMKLADDRYKWGIVVGHNIPPVRGAGSCIFLHVWKNAGATTGCTAMPEASLLELIHWLDPARHPVLVQLPSPVYEEMRKKRDLPGVE